MEISQTIKSASAAEKAVSDFLSLYAKGLVTYACALFFLIFGSIVAIQRAVPISSQNKIIFFSIVFVLFAASFVIHRNEVTSWKPISLAVLLGNSFGFVFSLIYFLGKILQTYNYPFSFFGIEKFVFYVPGGKADMNMMETMYGFVGGLLFVMTMSIIIGYGLSVRDKYKQDESKIVKIFSYIPVIIAIVAALGIFLAVIFYPSVIWYVVYAITGSMLYIYGANLFTKNAMFLKFM